MTDPIATVRNPTNPEEIVGEFELMDDEAVDQLLTILSAGREQWSAIASRRVAALHTWAQALEEDRDNLAQLASREVGKPIRESVAEVERAIAIIRYYAQAAYDPIGEIMPSPDARSRLYTQRIPLGLVLAVTPWNFPVAIPTWKIAPALAYGNTLAFKPASAALATANRLVELARPHIPPSVLGLLQVAGASMERVVQDDRVCGVSFTGSVEIGRAVVHYAASRGIPVQAEMGGQNPSIVRQDANLPEAAKTIAAAAMAYAGQKCTATSRVIVLRAVSERFISMLVDAISALPVGDPADAGTVVGPLISQHARSSVQRAVDEAVGRGARVLIGAEPLERPGWFYAPTLLRVDHPADPFAQTETFGPAAAVLVVDSDDQAVGVANATSYGLSAAVFGTDLAAAQRLAEQLDVGMVRINASTTGVDFYAPFGGEKASSYGPREQGRAAREFFTKSRTVLVSPAD
jgi:acyl-CoA reductase-like NAD-dependent aldehyde dehydrogenase